jgi:kynurenine formamidase
MATIMRIALAAGVVLLTLGTAAGAGQPERSPAATSPAAGGYVDLTYPFDDKTIYWPTDKPFPNEPGSEAGARAVSPVGCYSAASRFCTAEHAGTHLDAPAHSAPGRWTVDQIPLAGLVGPAVVVDLSERAQRDPDTQLEPADLLRWEAQHGPLPAGVILLVRTGWGRYWADKKLYLGTDRPGDPRSLHFPGIAPAAAQWLVENRRVKLVGIDTPSVDYGQSPGTRTHRILAEKNIPGLENVAELGRLPLTGATLYVLPLKLRGAGGAPCRVIATVAAPSHPAAPATPGGPSAAAGAQCRSDADCVMLPADCCGCSAGGKLHAVPRTEQAGELLRYERCRKTVLCPQVMSTDPSCHAKARCVSGQCQPSAGGASGAGAPW